MFVTSKRFKNLEITVQCMGYDIKRLEDKCRSLERKCACLLSYFDLEEEVIPGKIQLKARPTK